MFVLHVEILYQVMIKDFEITTQKNITLIAPKNVARVHKFELDHIFYNDLIKSKKQICFCRNFKNPYLPELQDYCRSFDVVFLESEGFMALDHNEYNALDPSKYIFISGDVESTHQHHFIPVDWLRTTCNFSKVNKKLWSKNKKYYLTARMNVPRQWKVELLSKLYDNKNLTWSALEAHPQIPGSPKIFESEKKGSNIELPSIEQMLSWSLLCLETEDKDITEKTYQHIYQPIPTIWHTTKSISYLEQFGLTIKFNGFDYSYLDMPREQKVNSLVKTIRSMNADDFKDFFHQNIKETENNYKIMRDYNFWYQLFRPKIQQHL